MTKCSMKQNNIRTTRGFAILISLTLVLGACVNTEPEVLIIVAPKVELIADKWTPLAKDGLHDMKSLVDPASPTTQLLQEPGEGLAGLPSAASGNLVNWVKALAQGAIIPRRAKTAPAAGLEGEELVMDMDIMMNLNGSMPRVRFPHRAHTMWLACANCHSAIFVPKKGANAISMERILMGEQCGICHGAVAFPPTECARCHSVPHMNPIFINSSVDAGGSP